MTDDKPIFETVSHHYRYQFFLDGSIAITRDFDGAIPKYRNENVTYAWRWNADTAKLEWWTSIPKTGWLEVENTEVLVAYEAYIGGLVLE